MNEEAVESCLIPGVNVARGLYFSAVSQGNLVFCGESIKIISMYAVLAAGKSERNQVAFFNPS